MPLPARPSFKLCSVVKEFKVPLPASYDFLHIHPWSLTFNVNAKLLKQLAQMDRFRGKSKKRNIQFSAAPSQQSQFHQPTCFQVRWGWSHALWMIVFWYGLSYVPKHLTVLQIIIFCRLSIKVSSYPMWSKEPFQYFAILEGGGVTLHSKVSHSKEEVQRWDGILSAVNLFITDLLKLGTAT